MGTKQKILMVLIPAAINCRYKGKSYATGNDIPVDYDDIDSLLAAGVLDAEVVTDRKVIAEAEAQEREKAEAEAAERAAAKAEEAGMLKRVNEQLLADNDRLQSDLAGAETLVEEQNRQIAELNATVQSHTLAMKNMTDQNATLQSALDAAKSTIATLEKAVKAKK